MEFRKVKYFLEVARLKSFSKAAKVLFVSQTAVSQQIAVLENELGFKLFIRDKKQVNLTKAGELFLIETKEIIDKYNSVVNKGRDIASGDYGTLRIAFFSMFDREVISKAIKRFHNSYPKAKISVLQCNLCNMKSNLLNGNIDIGFSFRMDSEELNEKNIFNTKPKLCVNRENELSTKENIVLEDLEDQSVISYIKNKEQQDFYTEHYKEDNSSRPNVNQSFLVENMDDALMLVNVNAGVCFLPEVKNFVNPNNVIFIDQTIETVMFNINAYWAKNNNSVVLNNFLDILSDIYD